MTPTDRLLKIAEKELSNLADNLIIKTDRGYQAFGKYEIVKQGQRFLVKRKGIDITEFGTAKTAISWCVADKYHQHELALQIQRLDARSVWARECIDTRQRLAQQGSWEFRETLMAKIQHRIQHKYQIDQELEKYIKRAKYLQHRGFSNDTQRTSTHINRKTGS